MGISFRHYLFAEDGSLRRLPQRIVDELPTGRDAIPEFAGTRQRVAYVVLENAEGRPSASSTPAANTGLSTRKAASIGTCTAGWAS